MVGVGTKMGRTQQLNVKLSLSTKDMLDAIGVFEGLKPTELVRMWITEKIGEYRKNKMFVRELNAGHLKKDDEEG